MKTNRKDVLFYMRIVLAVFLTVVIAAAIYTMSFGVGLMVMQ